MTGQSETVRPPLDPHRARKLAALRIEIAVASNLAEQAVEVITSSARTGQIGDGKIFVTPIDRALRIRTGETDSDAL